MKTQKTKKAVWAITLCVVALSIAILAVDLFWFPLQYLSVKFRPIKVERGKEGEVCLFYPETDGHAVIVQLPGGKFGLVGTGTSSYQALLRTAEGLKIRQFAFIALTSARDDEIGGVQHVLEYVGADAIWLTAAVKARPSYEKIAALAKKKKTKIYEMGLGSEIGTFGGVPVRALGPCMAEQSGLYYAQAPVWIGAGGGIVLSAAVNYEKVAVAVQTLLPEVILTGLSFMEIYQSGQESAAARFAPVEVRVNPDCKQQISAALPDAVVGTSGSAYEYRVRLNQWE